MSIGSVSFDEKERVIKDFGGGIAAATRVCVRRSQRGCGVRRTLSLIVGLQKKG